MNIVSVFNNAYGPVSRLSGTVTTAGTKQLLVFSGTGWSNTNDGQLEVWLSTNGGTATMVAKTNFFFNNYTIMTFPTLTIPLALPPGNQTFTVSAATGTVGDANDFFSLTLIDM